MTRKLTFCALAMTAAFTAVVAGGRGFAASEVSQIDIHAVAKPKRIVSLNLCLDQLLIELVDKNRIAAVSFLAKDATLSASPERFAGIKSVRGSAEEVLAIKPDLVLVGEYTTGATLALLRRLGQNVAVVPLANDFASFEASFRSVAKVVGESEKADGIITNFERRLSAIRSTAGARPTALAYQVNALVSGPHSLVDAAIEAAGYTNMARTLKLGPGDRLPLEQLIASPPDLVILANAPDDFRTVLADNLRHPALKSVLATRPHVHLPMPYWMCATPGIIDAVETLAAMKQKGPHQAARTSSASETLAALPTVTP